MSLIKTWKCDSCGAISRGDKPAHWYSVSAQRFTPPDQDRLFATAPKVLRHACSLDCVGRVFLQEEARAEIDALEVQV